VSARAASYATPRLSPRPMDRGLTARAAGSRPPGADTAMLSGISTAAICDCAFGLPLPYSAPVDDATPQSPEGPKVDGRCRPALPAQLMGARHLAPLQRALDQMHAAAAHGNTRVFDDHVLVLHLLAFFNPVVRSLRMMEDLSETPTARRLLGEDLGRVPKSTLSDAHARVDPATLLPVLRELTASLPAGSHLCPELAGIQQQILACDASYFQAVADLAWAIQNRKSNGAPGARAGLYTQLDVRSGVPFGGDGAGVALGGAATSESAMAAAHVVPGAIHLYDRGFVSFDLLRALRAGGADFVLRLTTQTKFTAVEERELTDADRAAGVISDRVGYLTGCQHSTPPGERVREVVVANDADPAKPMRLLTSLLDLPARQIGALYRKRWQVELFFRWLKMYGNYTHLISHDQGGATWAFYVAAIGVTLLALTGDRRPSKYDLALLSIVAAGGATLDEILPILRRRHRDRDLARARDAKRRRSHAAPAAAN
jgi:transposase